LNLLSGSSSGSFVAGKLSPVFPPLR
jgi:hypothetical protein